ncbi:MAG: hypothetical protein ABIS29_11760, partial [Vicinamibacterales bacterium]
CGIESPGLDAAPQNDDDATEQFGFGCRRRRGVVHNHTHTLGMSRPTGEKQRAESQRDATRHS